MQSEGESAGAGGPSSARTRVQWLGLLGGPLLALICYALLPDRFETAPGDVQDFSRAGQLTLLLLIWMAAWWLTEAVALQATALLPLVLLPLFGAATMKEAAAPYASPLIFLFLGGFLMALSMQRWGLDRRIALFVLRLAGTRPANLVGGFMVVTAVLSSCVSNTATVAMMLPIGLGVLAMAGAGDGDRGGNLKVCLMLAIAYAASIGGLATVIGSPPNGLLVQYAADQLGERISFLRWLAVGLPLTLVLLPVTWLLLTRVLHPLPREPLAGGRALLDAEWARLGPVKSGEWITLAVFTGAVAGWLARPLLADVLPGLTDAGIAITAGLLLFVLPVSVREHRFALDWDTAARLPWGVLILFGGGLSLAEAVETGGVGEFLGSFALGLEGLPPLVLVLAVTAGVVFLTELTSNTATAATLIPILAALAPGLGLSPLALAIPVTLAASCAFMLPVATPPNAILFGSGHVTLPQMMRAGVWLNLIATAAIAALTLLWVQRLLG